MAFNLFAAFLKKGSFSLFVFEVVELFYFPPFVFLSIFVPPEHKSHIRFPPRHIALVRQRGFSPSAVTDPCISHAAACVSYSPLIFNPIHSSVVFFIPV